MIGIQHQHSTCVDKIISSELTNADGMEAYLNMLWLISLYRLHERILCKNHSSRAFNDHFEFPTSPCENKYIINRLFCVFSYHCRTLLCLPWNNKDSSIFGSVELALSPR